MIQVRRTHGAPAGKDALISLCDLYLERSGKTVCSGFSTDIYPGDFVVLKGVSGAGKTSLGATVLGLLEPKSGQVLVQEALSFSASFQEDRLLDNMSIGKNLALVGSGLTSKRKRLEFYPAAQSCLRALNLNLDLRTTPNHLSGGQRRRIALARCLLKPAHVYFFDEPLRGLDVGTKAQVLKYILTTLEGKTVIWITHDTSELEMIENYSFNLVTWDFGSASCNCDDTGTQ